MPTVTGKLEASTNSTVVVGSVNVQLCGYGSQVPRINGVALVGQITTQNIEAGADGTFTFSVAGNDSISPAGTYYAVTVLDANGDIAQTNAYLFLSTTSSYDLTLIDPYDPNQPPPPLPPLLTNQLLIVPWSATPEFPGDELATWRITLTGDVTSSTAPDTLQGNLYTFIILQDSVGDHAFAFPPNCVNATPVNPTPNGITIQTFVMGVSDLVPIGAGTYLP